MLFTPLPPSVAQIRRPSHVATADGPVPPTAGWISQHWDTAILLGPGAVLVLDEVQKVPGWSETVKARWDDDTHHHRAPLEDAFHRPTSTDADPALPA